MAAKKADHQLAVIQSRLSGILVPLIIFYIKPYAMVHPLNKMLSILSTLYMNSWRHSIFCHTAQNRYMFKAAGIRATAPRLVFSGPTPLLLDPKAMVEHVNLTKAVIQTGQRNNYLHHQSDKRNREDSINKDHDGGKKDFRSGPQPRDKGKRREASQ
ncbi:hypothetical protein VTP01DRAFT_313 [Rhizomucor pusillus]|uniref:uncharacterized protein n=1 Tax=Rhizomucor pusillus TaxID=4840 RepID=UPI0037444257